MKSDKQNGEAVRRTKKKIQKDLGDGSPRQTGLHSGSRAGTLPGPGEFQVMRTGGHTGKSNGEGN